MQHRQAALQLVLNFANAGSDSSRKRTIDDGEDQAAEGEQRRAQGAEEIKLLCKQKHRHAQQMASTLHHSRSCCKALWLLQAACQRVELSQPLSTKIL